MPQSESTLSIVLLLLRTRPVDLADMGWCVTCLWLFVVAALVEDLRQVGSVDLPELLIIIQSGTQVPVFTCQAQINKDIQIMNKHNKRCREIILNKAVFFFNIVLNVPMELFPVL